MKSDRILEMERYISQRGSATMEELRQRFQVSMNTVRRDVAALLKRGSVQKIYGGVSYHHADQALTPYDVRRISGERAKIDLCRKAAELVQDGDIIFIDSGTTTLQLIDHLSGRRELTIITNNLEAIVRALPYENITIIALPGQVRRKTNSLTGDDAIRSLKRYNIRIAFMAATGVSTHGVTNSSPQEYEIKRCAVEGCEKAVLLVSGDKFGATGLMTFAPISAFDAIVTDRTPPQEYVDLLGREGTELLVAKP